MKRKTLSSILVIGLICTSLTGCVSFSYENPVKADAYVAELPDGETVVLDQEEAEAILQAQEELGITQEDIEKVHDEFSDEETVEEVEEETIERQKPFNLSEELGSKVGTTEALGIKYEIYKNGSVIETIKESFATIPEEIEYEGTTYPVVGLGDVHDEWTEFIIPSNIKYITENAFQLSHIKSLEVPDTVIYMSGSWTFSDSLIEKISLPKDLKTDSEWLQTFSGCSNLTSITVPENVTYLRVAFRNCSALTNVQLPMSLEIISEWCFENCENLKNVVIPTNVKEIGREAFLNTSLTEIILPNSLAKIRCDAFNDTDITELIIPDSAEMSDSENINILSCPNLNKIKYSNTSEYKLNMYERYKDNDSRDSELLIIFPDTLTDLDEGYFTNISSLKITIQVPENTVEYFKNKFPEINVVAKE